MRSRRVARWMAGVFVGAGILLGAPRIASCVTVSPLALVIDARTRSGTLTLYNENARPEEIQISFGFGYAVSNAQGIVRVELADSAPTGEPSAMAWLRAFPRRLILQPGQRQVVRIFVQPPADLPDGEYWARVLVSALGGRAPIEQEVRPDVRVSISIRTVFAPALLYRKGTVTTSVKVAAASAAADSTGPYLLLDLDRQGTAAFIGRIVAKVVGPDGKTLTEGVEPISVYHSLRVRVPLAPESGLVPPGSSIQYTIDTERPDLGTQGVLHAQTQSGTALIR